MGWSRGSRLMSDVIGALKKNIPDEKVREKIYKSIVPAFEDFDWDCQDECVGEDTAFDKTIKKLHPDWDW